MLALRIQVKGKIKKKMKHKFLNYANIFDKTFNVIYIIKYDVFTPDLKK